MAKRRSVLYFRNFIFGVEDSLVSTVGLLSGINVAGVSKTDIFLSGVVLIFVEAFSMGAGSYLSEKSASEFARDHEPLKITLLGGLIMFVSYFVSGFIPLAPYIFFERTQALLVSVSLSLAALFILGLFSSRYFKSGFWKHGLRMFTIGGAAITMGIVVGLVIN